MSLWKIAWRSMQQRGLASSLTALSMGLGVALVVAVLVILLTTQREQSLRHLLDLNVEYIRELRRKGKSDVEIAESFLTELKVQKGGLLYSLAKNRVMRYLSQLR